MSIHISCRQIDDFGTLGSGIVTCWHRWSTMQRWRQLWSWLSASVGLKCTRSFVSPACLWIPCAAISARNASGWVILRNQCCVSFYRSLHLSMTRKLNSLLFLFSHFSARFLYQILRFLLYGARIPSLAILAIFKARHMSDCSSCNRPPCLALVAGMLKTDKKLVAAANNEV